MRGGTVDFPAIHVLRHGETEWNVQGRLQGHFDAPLTARGRAQAARQGAILRGVDPGACDVFCSPQGRALETARIVFGPRGIAVRQAAALREIGLGDWAGKTRQELFENNMISGDVNAITEIYERAPQGEGLAALEARCAAFLARLQRPAVLITHGITSRMIRAIVTGGGAADVARMGGGQGVVFHLENGVQKRLE